MWSNESQFLLRHLSDRVWICHQFGINNTLCINSSCWSRWCNRVANIFFAHSLSIFAVHVHPSTTTVYLFSDDCFQQDNATHHSQVKSSETSYLNVAMSSRYSQCLMSVHSSTNDYGNSKTIQTCWVTLCYNPLWQKSVISGLLIH